MKIVLFANTDWYLYNFRRSLALALRDGGHEVLLISPPGPYGERLRMLGFRWQPVAMDRRGLNPWQEAVLIQVLARIFRRERADLVHSFTIKCAVYGSLAARLGGVPAQVSSVAGLGYVFISDAPGARALRPLVRGLLRLALSGASNRLILQNNDDVALFREAGVVDADRICLIRGSGVDCERFRPLDGGRPMYTSGTLIRVLLPARLLWDKGVAEFVEAARILRGQGRLVRMRLAGDPDPGNPAAVPVEQLRRWVTDNLVEWLGHVDEMPALLAETDVVVLPSYREGLPKSLIEAAACALPLVTTNAPGCREVVSDGIDGLRVPVCDAPALAAAIARLQDDPTLAKRLGLAARDKALREFDERIVVERTLATYHELLPCRA